MPTTGPAEFYRDALEAVLEALDIPHAATAGWDEKRHQILDLRAGQAVASLQEILRADPADEVIGVAWHTAYLRKKIAELPADGYVTSDEAQAAIGRGASWTEAVAEPRERTICGPGCCSPILGEHAACPGPHAGALVTSVR